MRNREYEEKALNALMQWYDGERPKPGKEPERYVLCAGLAITELVKEKAPLYENDYLTEKNQVKKTGGPAIKAVLIRYGESRVLAQEGGRTTRGTRPAAEKLVKMLNEIPETASLSEEERLAVSTKLQTWLVERVKEYFDRKKIEVEILLEHSGQQIVASIMESAQVRGVTGAVAQHLVGAKLSLRYPGLDIENHSYTTADLQLNRPGDFVVGDTVFHVTVSPMPAVLDKCEMNLRNNYRAILLVAESKLQAAKQMAEMKSIVDRVGILSIESFVGQNIEEMGEFERRNLSKTWRELLEEYNRRVNQVETDRSLLIEIPNNLQ